MLTALLYIAGTGSGLPFSGASPTSSHSLGDITYMAGTPVRQPRDETHQSRGNQTLRIVCQSPLCYTLPDSLGQLTALQAVAEPVQLQQPDRLARQPG